MNILPINETSTGSNLPAKKRGGAPKGNKNRTRHGLFSSELPKNCRYITNAVNAFRKQLESEVVATHGAIGVYYAALIQSATRHETRAKLLQRWLRESENEIKTTTSKGSTNGNGTTSEATVTRTTLGILEKAQLLRDISNASDSRDKCLEKLNLKQSSNNKPWASPPPLPKPACEDASESTATHEDNTNPIPEAAKSAGGASASLTEESEQ